MWQGIPAVAPIARRRLTSTTTIWATVPTGPTTTAPATQSWDGAQHHCHPVGSSIGAEAEASTGAAEETSAGVVDADVIRHHTVRRSPPCPEARSQLPPLRASRAGVGAMMA